jgi:aminomethyltransferase
MVPSFAGYSMPVLYTNLIQEHLAVRNSVSVFDVSQDVGEFVIKGERATEFFLQYVTLQTMFRLWWMESNIRSLPNDKGGSQMTSWFYKRNDNDYFFGRECF